MFRIGGIGVSALIRFYPLILVHVTAEHDVGLDFCGTERRQNLLVDFGIYGVFLLDGWRDMDHDDSERCVLIGRRFDEFSQKIILCFFIFRVGEIVTVRFIRCIVPAVQNNNRCCPD